MANYDILLLTDTGSELRRLDDCGPFSFTLAINAIGHFRLLLPVGLDRNLIRNDQRVEFWRQPPGGTLRRIFTGFIRHRAERISAGGQHEHWIYGVSANDLLRRRIVAYAAG